MPPNACRVWFYVRHLNIPNGVCSRLPGEFDLQLCYCFQADKPQTRYLVGGSPRFSSLGDRTEKHNPGRS